MQHHGGWSPSLAIGLVLLAAILTGCSQGPARIYPPEIAAARAGEAAVAEFDVDGDGMLSNDELAECPAILDAINRYDKNKDEQVSAEEIEQRIGELSRNGLTGMFSLRFRVLLDGQPLGDSQVELIPEAFLDGAVQPATGKSNAKGLVRPSMEGVTSSIDGVAIDGVQPGIYRLAIKGPTDEITERYGAGDELGLEVGPHVLGSTIIFDLSAK